MENAINLGNKNYVRDNLDQMLSMLAEDIQVIEIYLQFVETEKDTDADMRGNKVQDDSLGVSKQLQKQIMPKIKALLVILYLTSWRRRKILRLLQMRLLQGRLP